MGKVIKTTPPPSVKPKVTMPKPPTDRTERTDVKPKKYS